jgi:predicted ATPase
LERGIALYDSQQHDTHVFRAVQDRSVVFSYTAATLWQLGYADQALKKSLEAIALARELSHPVHLAVVLSFAAWLSQFRREWQAVQKQAEEAIAIATDQGFSYWLAAGTILRGWARAEQGWGEEGIMQMHQGLVAYQATGAELARTHFLALLAEAYGKVGQAEAGLSVLAEALAVVEKTGERWWEAELYRLKGELLLAQEGKNQKSEIKRQKSKRETDPRSLTPNPQEEAEACFVKALEIARTQQAKSLELRAAMSLVRLRHQQAPQHGSRTTQHEARDRLSEAHAMLSEVYHWFTEGFDTADLQDARVLLTSNED